MDWILYAEQLGSGNSMQAGRRHPDVDRNAQNCRLLSGQMQGNSMRGTVSAASDGENSRPSLLLSPESVMVICVTKNAKCLAAGDCPRWITAKHMRGTADTVRHMLCACGSSRSEVPGYNGCSGWSCVYSYNGTCCTELTASDHANDAICVIHNWKDLQIRLLEGGIQI